MSEKTEGVFKRGRSSKNNLTLSGIAIEGFKSIRERRVMPLTALNVVAGANSSGKSSFMQPLLLLKQTLEAAFDPGPLLINGPNVQFTELEQFFSKRPGSVTTENLVIGFIFESKNQFEIHLGRDSKGELKLLKNTIREGRSVRELTSTSTPKQVEGFISKPDIVDLMSIIHNKKEFCAFRDRSFYDIGILVSGKPRKISLLALPEMRALQNLGGDLIHVPGLRGQPDRRYNKTAVGDRFQGRMEDYVASIISKWQDESDPRLHKLVEYLMQMGLTSAVKANRIDASSIEIKVGRLPATQPSNPEDLVSIADVGFGVSQVLPVLVALLTGKDGQLVYIEQPEIHLHPKAQRALAHIFVDSIQRGAKVIVETHSSLFLREIQTLVAQGKADKDSINLHWVTRNQDGDTDIQTCKMDESGAYGDWPQDFDETEMQSATDYYTAAEARLLENK